MILLNTELAPSLEDNNNLHDNLDLVVVTHSCMLIFGVDHRIDAIYNCIF